MQLRVVWPLRLIDDGQMDAMFDQSNTALPQVASRRLKAIAITSLKPMSQYPGVPPLDEILHRPK